MKKLLCFLVFLNIGTYCFSQELEILPAKPWEEIVEINSLNEPMRKWGTDIKVKLEGNYTLTDSINIAKILKKLDVLTETISIKFSNAENSNLKLHFLDTPVREGNGYVTGRYGPQSRGQGYTSLELYIYKIDETDTDLKISNSLESRIAKALVGGSFAYPAVKEKRNSIFNPLNGKSNNGVSLNDEDKAIIKEFYKTGFTERLAKAENQFKETILKRIQDDKIESRDRNLWWVKNPVAVIILPALILVLIALFLIDKVNNSIRVNIKKGWLQFGVLALITLLFVGVLIVFCVSFYDFLTIPDDYQKVPLVRKDTILSTAVSLIILLPFLYLFRFIELKISKSSQQIFTKTALVFISTGFLPFVIYLLLAYFISDVSNRDNNYYYGISLVFQYLMGIASMRALIGYFIFKERSLIVENETKLANLRELKVKAELKSLQSQINPHFLYNSLNSIASLAPVDAEKTQKMAHSLSDLFKYSINRKGKKMSTVLDEVTMVKTYLDIEKIRFGDRLQFSVQLDKTLESNEIPLFLIQPLVENAVKHGISKNEGEGNIVLKIEKEASHINISVTDNGPDFPEGLVSGHGLQMVYDLLRLTYGDDAALNWTNTPEKMITITIPETL